MTFVPTTPPDCDNANGNYCESGFNEEMLPLTVVERDLSFTTTDFCSNESVFGIFKPLNRPSEASNILNLNSSNINACFDLQTRYFTDFWIPLNENYSKDHGLDDSTNKGEKVKLKEEQRVHYHYDAMNKTLEYIVALLGHCFT